MNDKNKTCENFSDLMNDPIVKSASDRAKGSMYGGSLEHSLYGNICFDNEGNIVRVTPFAIVIGNPKEDGDR